MDHQLILVIDDQPLSRILAQRQVGNRSGIIIPDHPNYLSNADPRDFGLIVVDRMMGPIWTESRDKFLRRVHDESPETQVVEWSFSANLVPQDRTPNTVMSIQKRDASELVPIVNRWLKYGTVIEPADAEQTA